MNIFHRISLGIGALMLALIPAIILAAYPTVTLLGIKEIKSNQVLLAVAFDSNGSTYQWENEPKVSITYRNQSTNQVFTSVSVGEAIGSRTTLFTLKNLVPNTTYTYKAVMNYAGTTTETAVASFKTPVSQTVVLDSGQSIPTGYPTFTLEGVQEITTNQALLSVQFDSRDANYSWNQQPKISISYTDATTGNSFTSLAIGESVGSRTSLFRLRNLTPGTKYYYKAIMYYGGQRYETTENAFTTKSLSQTTASATTSTTVPTISFNAFPTVATVSKTVGETKVASNLESIVKTGGYGTKNNVSLAITDSHARVVSGDSFEYVLQYHNANDKDLKIARIIVQLPDQYAFDDGDGNTVYSERDNTVTIYLGTIKANESGTVTFKARAIGGENDGVETRAVLIYTGGSVSAVDRDTYVGGSQGVLGATVFGSGFFPQTFFGWLVIIIILIIIMIMARRYLNRPPVPQVHTHEEKK